MAEDMDYPSSVILRLLQTGNEEDYRRVLSSRAVWLCVNCENCVGRCPKEVDIPRLMDFLRSQAVAEGCVSKEAKPVEKFYRAFLDSVRHTGRLYEVGLEADYKLRTGQFTQDVSLVPAMLAKGKLRFLPERIKDIKGMARCFSTSSPNENTNGL